MTDRYLSIGHYYLEEVSGSLNSTDVYLTSLQEWAAEHCSAPFRAPELWDCPSHADIDERTDIWSLGCTLYAIM
jgi:serine/threonine protein kinase